MDPPRIGIDSHRLWLSSGKGQLGLTLWVSLEDLVFVVHALDFFLTY
jgi:hypothetical protein